MKRSISVAVAIAALFAVGSAFTARVQAEWWNIYNPEQGTPGIYNVTSDQVKNIWCPGLNNQECAYLISNTNTIIKKP
jgi:hypothetical protein